MATAPGDGTSEREEENDDTIEGTVFSKSWVLSLLVKLVRAAEERPSEDEEEFELEETLENELCMLWDLTVNTVSLNFKMILFYFNVRRLYH